MGTNIPSNKAQAAVDAFLNSKPPDDNQPFIAGAAYAQAEIPLFTANWDAVVNGIYQPAVDNIISGKMTRGRCHQEGLRGRQSAVQQVRVKVEG